MMLLSRLMNYVMIHHGREVTHKEGETQGSDSHSTMWIKREINTIMQKLNWWQKKKNIKKEI